MSYCLKSMVPRVGGRLKTEGLTVTNVPGSLVSIFQTWAGKGEKKNILAITLFNSLRDEGLLSEGTSWTWHHRDHCPEAPMGRRVEKKQETHSLWDGREKKRTFKGEILLWWREIRQGLEGRTGISDRGEVGRKLLKMKMTGEFYLTV